MHNEYYLGDKKTYTVLEYKHLESSDEIRFRGGVFASPKSIHILQMFLVSLSSTILFVVSPMWDLLD